MEHAIENANPLAKMQMGFSKWEYYLAGNSVHAAHLREGNRRAG
ncbi:hypothetical protein J2X05_000418 [Cellvibrio fibrivorans]|jgi:hypothetical protein|uniref:Uncharacterized protein n=1 Tax=Cellvibrio fibrivorans TaxID=126350 RepID=A0ABU1UTE1_9GAMM|nr:hypothetical protein [Cellvibrio fibrivorans]